MIAAPRRVVSLWLVIGLLCVVVALLFWRLFLGEVPIPARSVFLRAPWNAHAPGKLGGVRNDLLGDVTLQMVPWHLLVWERLRALQLPLWNPWNTGGMPLLANDQAAPFAPLSLLGLLLPALRGLALTVPLKLAIAGAGMALYLRRLDCTRCGVWLGAVSFMLSGFMVVWLGWPHAQVAMLLPWLFWAAHGLLGDGGSAWMAALAVCTGASLLGGHAETSAHELYAVGFYALWLALAQRSISRAERFLRVLQFTVSVAMGLAIAGLQLVPLLEYLARSAVVELRSGQLPGAPFPAWTLLTWIAPQLIGHPGRGTYINELGLNFNEQCGYAGLVALAAAGAAVWRRPERLAALPLITLASLAAIVVYGGPARSLLIGLPALHLAANQRLLLVIEFAVSALGALGFTALARDRRSALGAASLSGALVLTATAGGVAFHRTFGRWANGPGRLAALSHARYQVALWVPILVLLALILMFVLHLRSTRCARWTLLPLALLAPCDLLAFAWNYNPTVPARDVFPSTPEIRFLQDQGQGAWTAALGWRFPPNLNVVYRVRDLRSYDAVMDSRWMQYFRAVESREHGFDPLVLVTAPNLAPLEVAGVHFISTGLQGSPGPSFRKVWSDDDSAIWEDPGARPIAYFADAIRVGSRQEAEQALASGTGFQRNLAVLVEEPVVAEAGRETIAPFVTRVSPEHIQLDVEVQRPRLLVVNESYDPGWVATIDGARAKLQPANLVFQSVVVPAGRHRVELRYRPTSVLIGAILSALGLAGLAVLILLDRLERRRGAVQ